MTRPTLDELKALYPTTGKYAGAPGSGPVGKTCRSCCHKVYTGHHRRPTHPKCGLTAYTHGDATTIKTSTPACHRYEEAP